ncbi:LOW QUALITY PROTEIN: hypothetical protein U9M48_003840 [Paspalum notatum var. saurae]|uniref:Tf2-1-like SH3-like domain-containing protein n=1 Tax=Paspalum notatum var. saurae TaxID=547442 RepID=A0AAQ3SKY5_PASNO
MPNFLITIVIEASIKMSPFRALYEGANSFALGSTGEKRVVWSRNHRRRRTTRLLKPSAKSYADNRRRDLEFAVGDYVYLKVSPIRGLRRFKVKGKLAPRYIGPFKIIDRKGEVAYQLELHDRLSGVHDVFHVSRLKKCTRVHEEQLQEDELNVRDDLTYTRISGADFGDGRENYRNGIIKMCKVKWSHHTARGGHMGKRG